MASTDSDNFYLLYGKAMAAWADVENTLCRWFCRILEPQGDGEVKADSIFYSARSFGGRADMLKAASGSRRLTNDQRSFVRKAIKKATDYNGFRAKLAHRETVEKIGFGPDEDGLSLCEGHDRLGRDTENPPIKSSDLENAAKHFRALSWLIDTAGLDEPIWLQESLRLIGQLPKQPNLSVDNQLIEEVYAERV